MESSPPPPPPPPDPYGYPSPEPYSYSPPFFDPYGYYQSSSPMWDQLHLQISLPVSQYQQSYTPLPPPPTHMQQQQWQYPSSLPLPYNEQEVLDEMTVKEEAHSVPNEDRWRRGQIQQQGTILQQTFMPQGLAYMQHQVFEQPHYSNNYHLVMPNALQENRVDSQIQQCDPKHSYHKEIYHPVHDNVPKKNFRSDGVVGDRVHALKFFPGLPPPEPSALRYHHVASPILLPPPSMPSHVPTRYLDIKGQFDLEEQGDMIVEDEEPMWDCGPNNGHSTHVWDPGVPSGIKEVVVVPVPYSNTAIQEEAPKKSYNPIVRDMKEELVNPRIILLDCLLEYKEGENQTNAEKKVNEIRELVSANCFDEVQESLNASHTSAGEMKGTSQENDISLGTTLPIEISSLNCMVTYTLEIISPRQDLFDSQAPITSLLSSVKIFLPKMIISDINPHYKRGKTTVDVKKSGKLDEKYLYEHTVVTSRIGLKPMTLMESSGAIGSKENSLGAEVGFNSTSAIFTKYSAWIGLNKHDFSERWPARGLSKVSFLHYGNEHEPQIMKLPTLCIEVESDCRPPRLSASAENSNAAPHVPVLEFQGTNEKNEFKQRGEKNCDNIVSLVLRIADSFVRVRNIQFQFYLDIDAILAVVGGMGEQLELSKCDMVFIANFIDFLIMKLVPGRKPSTNYSSSGTIIPQKSGNGRVLFFSWNSDPSETGYEQNVISQLNNDDSIHGEPWVENLINNYYSELSTKECLDALVALIDVASEGSTPSAYTYENLIRTEAFFITQCSGCHLEVDSSISIVCDLSKDSREGQGMVWDPSIPISLVHTIDSITLSKQVIPDAKHSTNEIGIAAELVVTNKKLKNLALMVWDPGIKIISLLTLGQGQFKGKGLLGAQLAQ